MGGRASFNLEPAGSAPRGEEGAGRMALCRNKQRACQFCRGAQRQFWMSQVCAGSLTLTVMLYRTMERVRGSGGGHLASGAHIRTDDLGEAADWGMRRRGMRRGSRRRASVRRGEHGRHAPLQGRRPHRHGDPATCPPRASLPAISRALTEGVVVRASGASEPFCSDGELIDGLWTKRVESLGVGVIELGHASTRRGIR